jgi:hypothetical protein
MTGLWVAVGAVFVIAVVAILLKRGVLNGSPKAEKAPEQVAR